MSDGLNKETSVTTIIINVSFNEDVAVIRDFIQNEQIPYIFGFGMEKLKRFEWYINDRSFILVQLKQAFSGQSNL